MLRRKAGRLYAYEGEKKNDMNTQREKNENENNNKKNEIENRPTEMGNEKKIPKRGKKRNGARKKR